MGGEATAAPPPAKLAGGDPAPVVRRFLWDVEAKAERETLIAREWLVTNGLGGYASSTISMAPTRRYHGLLIAALPAPLGRTMMLCDLTETIELASGEVVRLGGAERPGDLDLHGAKWLREFRLQDGLPVWTYQFDGARLEKRLMMPHLQNSTLVRYRLSGEQSVTLRLRPLLHVRSHDAPVDTPLPSTYHTSIEDDAPLRLLIGTGEEDLPLLRLATGSENVRFEESAGIRPGILYRVEASRGYAAIGDLWSPGEIVTSLDAGDDIGFCVSTDEWAAMPDPASPRPWEAEQDRRTRLRRLAGPVGQEPETAELVLSADPFIILPATRLGDTARAHAAGEEARSIIAGYHWFTDWGRDTMISLEGLALTTGRHREAGAILRTFARHASDGLIPNLFPEGRNDGLYHTADATLWFFHALHRYEAVTGDDATARQLRPILHDIVRHHVRGTRFGIGVDPDDGLLRQGADGYQLTWMDAKVEDWVVTPRRGKAVEINALWYNALRLLQEWEERWAAAGAAEESSGTATSQTTRAETLSATTLRDHADRARASFNQRFWYAKGEHLYDVVDGESGDDAAFRPNQLFSISLPYAVLAPERWEPVLSGVRERLLTPVGLRSLAPDHVDYKATYHGDLRTRDAAYHQGTVWSWLIGPYVDAWMKVYPDDAAAARAQLSGLIAHLDEAGMGSVSEIFDAEPPYRARGCIAQAWGVAELLRCLVKTTA